MCGAAAVLSSRVGAEGRRAELGAGVVDEGIQDAGLAEVEQRGQQRHRRGRLLATRSHAAADNPLRCNGQLRAVHLCEYGAQAMAVHGGLLARAAGRRAEPGLLVALRDVRLHLRTIEHLPDELQVEAERLLASAASWQYAFRVSHAGQLLAAGRAAVMLNPLPCG